MRVSAKLRPLVVGICLCLLWPAPAAAQSRAAPAGGKANGNDLPAIPSLEAALAAVKADDPRGRMAAARWIAEHKPDPAVAVPALVPLLDDPELREKLWSHVAVRAPSTEAHAAIGALGPAAIEPLIQAFNAGLGPAARKNVLYLLAGIGRGDVRVLKLLTTATSDPDPDVRVAAAGGLGQFNLPEAVDALLPLLDDPRPNVRAMAARSLGAAAAKDRPGGPITNFQQSKVIETLAVLLKDADPAVKVSVVDAFGRLRSGNAVEPLVAVAGDPDLHTALVQALGAIDDRRGTMAVVHVLEHAHNSTARSLACQALGKLQDVRGVSALLRAAAEADRGRPGGPGHDALLAMNATTALGAIGDRRATPLLVELLRSPDERTRMNAAESLGRIRDPQAVAPLIAALNADDATAGAAALALGEIGDPSAIEPLAALLFGRGEHGGSAVFGADALAKIHSPKAIRALVEGTIAVKRHGDHTFRARRALDKLLDTNFDFDQDGLTRWWAEHRHEFDGE